jgi:hypothetical protein
MKSQKAADIWKHQGSRQQQPHLSRAVKQSAALTPPSEHPAHQHYYWQSAESVSYHQELDIAAFLPGQPTTMTEHAKRS